MPAGCVIQQEVPHIYPLTYRCYTQAEWDAKQLHDGQVAAATQAQADQSFKDFADMGGWWYLGGFVLAILVGVIWKSIKDYREEQAFNNGMDRYR